MIALTDVLIFGGQSNMQGQTEKLIQLHSIPALQEYRFLEDAFVPLCDPCGEDIHADGTPGYPYSENVAGTWHKDNVLGSACDGHTTLLPAFCQAYYQHAKEKAVPVAAVHAAKGSTEIVQWMPGTDGYNMLVKKARRAIERCKTVRHRYFIWLQGESDAICARSEAEYKLLIKTFAYSLKQDLDIEKFAIIRVGRFTMDERDCAIQKAQDEITGEDPFFVMLTTITNDYCQDPAFTEMMNPEVHGHYSAKGLVSLGAIAGEALAKLL